MSATQSLDKFRKLDPSELKAISRQTARAAGPSIEAFFHANKAALEALVADVMRPERLLKVAQTAIRQTPKLQECTVASLFGAVIICATMGLEPNTHEEHCWLIPRRRGVPRKNERGQIMKDPSGQMIFDDVWEVNVQIGYKGHIELAYRSPKVKLLKSVVAHKNDKLAIYEGTEQRIDHQPLTEGDRGPVIGYYAIAKLDTGETLYEWFSMNDIIRIRDTYSDGYKQAAINLASAEAILASTSSTAAEQRRARKDIAKAQDIAWIRDFNQMARKTTIHRITNYLPGNRQGALAQALDARDSEARSQGLSAYIEGDPILGNEVEVDGDEQEPGLITDDKTINVTLDPEKEKVVTPTGEPTQTETRKPDTTTSGDDGFGEAE